MSYGHPEGSQLKTSQFALSLARGYEHQHGFEYNGYILARWDMRFKVGLVIPTGLIA
jgi:hypothetical protein